MLTGGININKLIIFPLAFLFILSIFSIFFDDQSYIGSSNDYEDLGKIRYRENESTNNSGEIYLPEGGSHSFNIWNTGLGAGMVILITALAIGIIAGIKVFGWGVSELSQSMIFNSILLMGLWACLSVVSIRYLFDSSVMSLFWVSLTVIFVLGVGTHITSSGDY